MKIQDPGKKLPLIKPGGFKERLSVHAVLLVCDSNKKDGKASMGISVSHLISRPTPKCCTIIEFEKAHILCGTS